MRRREFIMGLASAAALLTARPLSVQAQQRALPIVAFINNSSLDASVDNAAAFRGGLAESGYVEGRNVVVEYHWLEGLADQVPALVADLVRRRVAVIATPGFQSAALAAKAATTTIPIVFGAGENPVSLGLVSSLARPGGNATGMNALTQEMGPKLLGLLHALLPKAVRVAVLANPRGSPEVSQERMLGAVQDAARVMGLARIDPINAGTSREIEQAFARMTHDGAEALIILPDGYFASRRVQLATFGARFGIPAASFSHQFAEAGGLMSYGSDIIEIFHLVGAYTGQILKGANPADLPVVQSTKFEFVINVQTARLLGIEVPPALLAITNKVIE